VEASIVAALVCCAAWVLDRPGGIIDVNIAGEAGAPAPQAVHFYFLFLFYLFFI